MNKRIYIFFWAAAIMAVGMMSISVVAQSTDKDTFVAKTGEKMTVSTISERKFVPYTSPSAGKKQTKPTPTGKYKWEGAYAGGQAGYGFGMANTKFDPLPTPAIFIDLKPTTLKPSPTGFIAGGQIGYNTISGKRMIGVEVSAAWSNMKGSTTVKPIINNAGAVYPGTGFLTASQSTNWLGTARGRYGKVFDNVLIYATGGLAMAGVKYSANADFRNGGTARYPVVITKMKWGWTAGGGFEVGVRKHWSWKTEFLYYDLGSATETGDPIPPFPSTAPPWQIKYTWQTRAFTFNSGLNYRW